MAEVIEGMGSVNERRRFIVMWYLIDWTHTHNDPWMTNK